MNEVIYETVVTTMTRAGAVHVAPMGVRYEGERVLVKPFRPSATLDAILDTRCAVLNVVVDTRVFAGCVTGRRDWPTLPATRIAGVRLACALSHAELVLDDWRDDAQRPLLRLRRVADAQHAPYVGFNRAQAAVLEGAVLVSRLKMLPPDKVRDEMAYLQIAIDKTAGPAEHEAWGWLREAVRAHAAAARGED